MSVVTPFFERAPLLPGLIAGLEAQSFRDFELVIVDDGSTDGLHRAVDRVSAGFPLRCVRLLRNAGAAAARNIGIDAARGRYIALLDSDDGCHPQKLARQVQHLIHRSDDDMLVSLTRQRVSGRRDYVAPARLMTVEDRVGPYLFVAGGIIQSSMMMLRRDLAARVRFDDASRCHDDWSFALRLELAGARFEMLPGALTLYDDRDGRVRRSPAYSAARLHWLAEHRALLGEKAYWAAVAAVASRLPARGAALALIHAAHRNGGISTARAGYYAAAAAVPAVRSLARAAVAWRAARAPEVPVD